MIRSARAVVSAIRLRMFLVYLRTRLKNRIHGTLTRDNYKCRARTWLARLELGTRLSELPEHSYE